MILIPVLHKKNFYSTIIKGLEEVDLETRQKIMELYEEACACEDNDLEIARKIAAETTDEEQILARVNKEISWCGTWVQSTCAQKKLHFSICLLSHVTRVT